MTNSINQEKLGNSNVIDLVTRHIPKRNQSGVEIELTNFTLKLPGENMKDVVMPWRHRGKWDKKAEVISRLNDPKVRDLTVDLGNLLLQHYTIVQITFVNAEGNNVIQVKKA